MSLKPALGNIRFGKFLTIMGQSGLSWSYKVLASAMLQAWKVNCRQQQPMPKPMASM